MSEDYARLTDEVMHLGMKRISLRKFEDGQISILINGFGLGHCSPEFAATWFPEARDWIIQ